MQGQPTDESRGEPSGERGERIAKLLARAGVASRREIERMIAEKRIARDGEVIDTPATLLTSLSGITVDGKPVARPERTRLFRFHKPSGLLTAERDPAGRPTIYAALRNALPAGTPRMMPIGRLDLNTEGLLLLTNDGEFKRLLELPANGVPRTYRARTFGDISQAQLEDLIDGITVEGVNYGRIDANLERRTGRNQWIELTLSEGKNREVRRVLEHLGLKVSRLIRTAYGPFELGDLRAGGAEEVRKEDLERFRSGVKAPGTPSRGARDEDRGEPRRASPPRRKAAPPPSKERGGAREAPRPPRNSSTSRTETTARNRPEREKPERGQHSSRASSASRGRGTADEAGSPRKHRSPKGTAPPGRSGTDRSGPSRPDAPDRPRPPRGPKGSGTPGATPRRPTAGRRGPSR